MATAPTASRFLYGEQIHANGIRQHYLRYGGSGIPLVLIPGITSPAITWGFVAERLASHFDVYVLDVRGRGLSEAGADLDYSLDLCTSDVLAFIEALTLRGSVVLGHSMGARIAIRVARHHPRSNLGGVVLVDPPVTGPGRRKYPISLEWMLTVLRAAKSGISLEQMRAFVPTWQDAHIRLRAEWLATCDQRAVEAAYRGFHEDDIHSDLPHLKLPTLLVVAGKGGVIQPQDVAEIKQLLPTVRVECVPRASHMIPWEDCEGFFAAISPFLDQILITLSDKHSNNVLTN